MYRDFEDIISSSWNDKWRKRLLATIDYAEAVTAGKPEPKSERGYVIY